MVTLLLDGCCRYGSASSGLKAAIESRWSPRN